MRSKKLAVWCVLLSVLLMNLSATAAPDLVRTSPDTSSSDVSLFCNCRVATPEFSCTKSWRGWVIVSISCDTPGATIWYSWNGSSVRKYQYPLIVTRDAVVIAWATKPGWRISYGRKLIIDFWPYGNVG